MYMLGLLKWLGFSVLSPVVEWNATTDGAAPSSAHEGVAAVEAREGGISERKTAKYIDDIILPNSESWRES
jgi:hypothetical protein